MTLTENLSRYITLEDEILEFIDHNVQSLEVKKGQLISDQNTLHRNVYFVEKGLLRSFYYEKGKDITTNFYPENSLLANKDTLFQNTPARNSIEALEDSCLSSFSFSKLQDVCSLSLTSANFAWRVLGVLMVSMERRLHSLQYMTAKERYLELLDENPSIVRRAPLGMIASFLGISQETLSRIRSTL